MRPKLKYDVPAWATAAKSNHNKLDKVQIQALRIITGATKTTLIEELQSIKHRRKLRTLLQAQTLKEHPVYDCIHKQDVGRLKRTNFVQTDKKRLQNDPTTRHTQSKTSRALM